jgi:HAD superfamily hydrolase (TIGR01509 family)
MTQPPLQFPFINHFDLFLFDFDGLLVNTEHLHYQAYLVALAERGISLDWSFPAFCERAHLNGDALREALVAEAPQLAGEWLQFYEEKKRAYQALIVRGKIELMPGVAELLAALEAKQARRCVVTNSTRLQTDLIKGVLPLLKTLPHWITREDYTRPKPDPEGYLRAIALHGQPGDRIIGFEDTIRGLRALQRTPALPILVCPHHHPHVEIALNEGERLIHVESFAGLAERFFLGQGAKNR